MSKEKEVVACEECGREGPKDEIGVCGDWIGTPEDGYACSDIICPDCRTVDEKIKGKEGHTHD